MRCRCRIRPQSFLSDQSGGSQPAVRHGPRLGARRSSICGIILRRWDCGAHCATPTMMPLTGIEILERLHRLHEPVNHF